MPGASALEAVALELRIRQLISKDPALAKELAALLPAGAGTSQSAVVVGDGNTVQQASGMGIQLSANRGAGPE